jgi:hypothetical protein
VLSTSAAPPLVATPGIQFPGSGVMPLGSPGPVGYYPAQIRHAYGIDQINFNGITGDGTGQTIAIVDEYDNPNIAQDLAAFDAAFGGPNPPSFTKVDQNGGTNYPGVDPTGNWETEEALDVEWAHVVAPGASIVLVECTPSGMLTGVNTARNLPGVSVVSMSWGARDFSGESNLDSFFTTPPNHGGVTFVAGAGDTGAGCNYPSSSPNVLAVGGTTLSVDNFGNYIGETAWSGSGGGPSANEPVPAYQVGVQNTGRRTTPDVAFDADPNTGVAVYDSYNNGTASPWVQIGGTSLATPCWAGLVAIADQGRALNGLGPLDGRQQVLPAIYQQLPVGDFHDITTGSNGHPAGPGYDMVTGRGTPIANVLVPALSHAQDGQYHPAVSYSTGTRYANAVVTGDFYGDGKLDLVTANHNCTGSLFRGNGSGTFQAPVQIKTPDASGGPDALAVGDFNHDGKLDLVVANYYTNTISVLMGNGNGTFQPGVDYAVGKTPTSIVVGDFNHDGNLDLAVADEGSNSVSVLLGNGNGTFKPAVNYAVNGYDIRIAVGDFNGDGNLDLVTANEYYGAGETPNTVSVLLGNGNGTFKPAVNYAAGTLPDAVAVGDFNHDGHLDLAVADYGSNKVSILLGNGNGTFKAPVSYAVGVEPISIQAADLNGDGKLDLVVADRGGAGGSTDPLAYPGAVSVLWGNGNGTFKNPLNLGVDLNPSTVVVADFNGDGKPDLAVSCRGGPSAYPGTVDVLLHSSTGPNPLFAVGPSATGTRATSARTAGDDGVARAPRESRSNVLGRQASESVGAGDLNLVTPALRQQPTASPQAAADAFYALLGDSSMGMDASALGLTDSGGPSADGWGLQGGPPAPRRRHAAALA